MGHSIVSDSFKSVGCLSCIAPPIELPIEDLLPSPEIQPPFRHGHDDLAANDLTLDVCVGVVLTGAVVLVLTDGDEDRGGDMHGTN